MIDLSAYWRAVLNQDAEAMRGFLCEDASVRWHNTNEEFTREEFIRADYEYLEWQKGRVLLALFASLALAIGVRRGAQGIVKDLAQPRNR